MGLQRAGSQRQQHQTLGVQILAGVTSEDYWDYQPDQRVMTTDGFPGTVRAVLDGPVPGTEEYQVTLDGGMGGGSYTASQLSPAPATTAGLAGTAAEDYPELSTILVERPDPARQQVYAAMQDPESGDGAGGDSPPPPENDGDDDADDDTSEDTGDSGSDDTPDDASNEDSDGASSSDDDSGSSPPWEKSSALFDRLITTAVADADFRFHVTAAWRDVVAKAKRIRSEGRLRVTLASDGLVFGEIQGDHHVYETGLQRLPGHTAVQSWSCGCKWGAYHWGADDDFSRFAGRMCSHALALTYEAQSRGMFGRDVEGDDDKPTWVPRKVVIRYDIDSGQNQLVRSSSLAAPAGGVLQTLASEAIHAGADRAETLTALYCIQPNASWDSWSDGVSWKEPHKHEWTRHNFAQPQEHTASVADPLGEPGGTSYQLPRTPGATAPKVPWENPTSAGPLAAADPEGWNRTMPMEPVLAAADPAVFEPGGTEATLNEAPEGALPSTDGVEGTDEDMSLAPALGLRRQAFSNADRHALITEGEGLRATNLDRLQIAGTHYEDLEQSLVSQEDDTSWLA